MKREDFSMTFDAMNAVTGPYAKKIFVEVGCSRYCEHWCIKQSPASGMLNGYWVDFTIAHSRCFD